MEQDRDFMNPDLNYKLQYSGINLLSGFASASGTAYDLKHTQSVARL